MIKVLLTLAVTATLLPSLIWANGAPPSVPSAIEPEFTSRLFYQKENFNHLFELTYRNEVDRRRFVSFRIGSYYRLLTHLKVGLFYRRQWGVRHDEDWSRNENGDWSWSDSRSRGENQFTLDLTPRMALSFLPGSNWVGEIKTRFSYNSTNQKTLMRIRPGLRYFWQKHGTPWMSAFAQYEIYLPLNFADRQIWEKWFYLGALYHLSSTFQVGTFWAHRQITWRDHPLSRSQSQVGDLINYETNQESNVLGLLLVIRLAD